MKNALVKLTRQKIESLEKELLNNDHPGIVRGNTDSFPLKHSFSEGVYIREMFMEKDGIVIGRLHKYSHTWFLMQGEIMVATDHGTEVYIAPCYVHAPAGAKRVINALKDSIFINVHPNPLELRNIEELEDMLTCPSYNDFDKYKQLK
jgi:quercetin dioxygenase-like cupin family protein|tara:strand:- start:85 stop:528 length:444 start_codon:yes stop_codon:yes gene_type:complete